MTGIGHPGLALHQVLHRGGEGGQGRAHGGEELGDQQLLGGDRHLPPVELLKQAALMGGMLVDEVQVVLMPPT